MRNIGLTVPADKHCLIVNKTVTIRIVYISDALLLKSLKAAQKASILPREFNFENRDNVVFVTYSTNYEKTIDDDRIKQITKQGQELLGKTIDDLILLEREHSYVRYFNTSTKI